MNYSPELSTGMAVFMSLFAAFLWGSWFISLKYLNDYPLDGFYITLFTTSLVFVWTVGLVIDGQALFDNIRQVAAVDPGRIWVTLVCGVLYVIGIRISLFVMSTIGLSLAQPIQSSINIIIGTAIAALVGGMPERLTPSRLILATFFLVMAVFLSMLAGNMKTHSKTATEKSTIQFGRKELWRSLGFILLASAFTPAYTYAISYGLQSVTQNNGLAVLPFMACLASGAFVGAVLSSGIPLTIRKQWKIVFHAPFSIHKFGILSGLAHYGGNIIHTFGTAYLSSAVSWPLGVTSTLWTQIWGLVYGEFRGASRKIYITLFSGILFYLIGAYIIASL
jgi:hypothetical protein